MKKTVILMIPQLKHGGAERVVSRLSFILNSEYDLKVVVFDDSDTTYDVGCELISLDIPPISKGHNLRRVINVLKRIIKFRKLKRIYEVDLTYSFGDTANIINILSGGNDKKISSIRGFKRIRMKSDIKNIFFLRPISKFVLKRSDAVVSVSELITKTLIKEYHLSEDKVKTIYNGYDINQIKGLSRERLNNKMKPIFNEGRVLITAGTFRPEKGYWHLLKAFSILKKNEENEDLRLVILGTDYNNYMNKVVNLANQLKINDSVHMLGYKKNPFKYIASSDIYVLSSVFEGFPNSLVEAMACGLPVVATDCESGPREILAPNSDLFKESIDSVQNEYGVLVNRLTKNENYDYKYFDRSDQKLAFEIQQLLDNKGLQNRFSQKSLERVNFFSNEVWKVENLKLINRLVSK